MKIKKHEFVMRIEHSGENQSSFAEKCGFAKQTINAWILGERNPKPANVEKMANVLCCKIADIAEYDMECDTLFSNEENLVAPIRDAELFGRKFQIYGTMENPLFLAKDVAEWIEYSASNVSKLVEAVDDDEKVRTIVTTLGGNQSAWFLTEDGLYEVLMLSRKPIAKQFKRGVKQILHDYRTKGIAATPHTIDAILDDPEFGIRLLTELKKERSERARQEAINAEQRRALELAEPKVVFADSISVAKTSILVGEMAKLIKQSTGTDIGQNRFFDFLRDNGYLHRMGSQKNLPTQRSIDSGWFEIKEGTRVSTDGVSIITRTPKITGKGQIYFINLFCRQK